MWNRVFVDFCNKLYTGSCDSDARTRDSLGFGLYRV